MPRPRTAEVVYEEIVELQCERMGCSSSSRIDGARWFEIQDRIEKLNEEALALEAAGKRR